MVCLLICRRSLIFCVFEYPKRHFSLRTGMHTPMMQTDTVGLCVSILGREGCDYSSY